MASQRAGRIKGVVADALGGGFAGGPAKEALGPTVTCRARMLSFACVFVLG